MHHPALQPGIVIEKTYRAESQARILQQFTQDELPTSSSTVDERSLARDVGTLLHVVQNTIRTPYSDHQRAEEQRIEQIHYRTLFTVSITISWLYHLMVILYPSAGRRRAGFSTTWLMERFCPSPATGLPRKFRAPGSAPGLWSCATGRGHSASTHPAGP